jgi:hypothetical protein
MKTSEDEIKEALRRRAEGFDMPDEPPHHLVATIRRRRSRNGWLVGLGSATLAAVVAASVFAVQLVAGTPAGSRDGGTRTDGVALISYVVLDPKVATGEETRAPSWLSDHIACMRDQGFDIPDPTETPDGWSINVDDPAAAGLGTPAWREAAFVTCAIDRPLSGNLILGISKNKVDAFVTCMAGQGYELPASRLNREDEYEFDLTATNIDTGRAAWDRAVFVTCSPEGGIDG